jgi:hypothetical protein
MNGLLQKPSVEPWGLFTCLNSLRDVEPTVHLILTEDSALDSAPEFVTREDAAAAEEEDA